MMFDLIVGFAYFVMCIFLFYGRNINFFVKPHESETLRRRKKLIVCDVLFRDKVQHVLYEGHYGLGNTVKPVKTVRHVTAD